MALNPDQLRAVLSKGHALVSACPGSGKTRVLVERAKHLLASDPNAHIAAITFTKDAASEMITRMQGALRGQDKERVIAGTFHSLAMGQINATRAKRGERALTVLSEGQARILVKRAWQAEAPERTYNEILKEIEAAKATRIPPQNPNGPVARALKHYQQLLHEQDAYDFADLVARATDGMLSGELPPLACTHMLVDEMQDVDQTQVNWIMAHVRHQKILTCVGDDDQSVYAFRHALGFTAMRAFADACDAEEIVLGTTYRCAASILNHATRLIAGNNRVRIQKTIRTTNTERGKVERREFSEEAEEAETAALHLAARPARNNRGEPCTAAILARTNSVLRTAEAMLRKHKIPYRINGKSTFWDAGVPGLLRGLLGAFAGKGSRGISLQLHGVNASRELIRAVDHSTRGMADPVKFLLTSSTWKKNLSAAALRDFAPMHAALATAQNALTNNQFETALAVLAERAVAGSGTQKGLKVAEVACDALKELSGSVRDRLRVLDRMERAKADDPNTDPRAIALLTIHASKGLEFDQVWLMGMAHGVLPHKDSFIEEERRLCYVGMTRAKTDLVLSTSVEEGAQSGFFAEMGLSRAIHRKSA